MKETIIPAPGLNISNLTQSDSGPTAKQMKGFAGKFTSNQWILLCNKKEFVRLVGENLEEANKLAGEILNKK
jgi:hypothetical protein